MYGSDIETLTISEEMVNPKDEKVGPASFQLLKVLGKGGYGKVTQCIIVSLIIENNVHSQSLFNSLIA